MPAVQTRNWGLLIQRSVQRGRCSGVQRLHWLSISNIQLLGEDCSEVSVDIRSRVRGSGSSSCGFHCAIGPPMLFRALGFGPGWAFFASSLFVPWCSLYLAVILWLSKTLSKDSFSPELLSWLTWAQLLCIINCRRTDGEKMIGDNLENREVWRWRESWGRHDMKLQPVGNSDLVRNFWWLNAKGLRIHFQLSAFLCCKFYPRHKCFSRVCYT